MWTAIGCRWVFKRKIGSKSEDFLEHFFATNYRVMGTHSFRWKIGYTLFLKTDWVQNALIWYFYYWVTSFPTPILPSSNGKSIDKSMSLQTRRWNRYEDISWHGIYSGYLYGIYFGIASLMPNWRNLGFSSMRFISQSPWTGCPDLFGILCLGLPTLTRFFYLDWLSEFLTGLGVLDPGPSLVSGFFSFFFKLSSRLCVSGLFRCELS
jgi:hypothetical protein